MSDVEPGVRLVVETLPCGVVVASTLADGRILMVNQEFTTITGYTHQDVPTVAHWLDRAYPDPIYRAQVMANWERDVSEPGRDVFYEVCCADGQRKELLLRAGLVENDQMVVAVLDVSPMKRVERELRESEERFKLIAETVDQVFWIHGIQPEAIEYVSPAFEEIWGVPVRELYDAPGRWSSAIVDEDRPAVDRAWNQALDGRREMVDFCYRIRRPDGSLRWVEDRGIALRDEAGHVTRMVGIAKDVTARRMAEQAAHDAEQRSHFAQKMDSLGLLAGGVAHDLNNLLMGILGNVELAGDPSAPRASTDRCLRNISLAAKRASELATQMLLYAGKGKSELSPLDLRTVVGEIGQLLAASISKNALLEHQSEGDTATIRGDATQIRQVAMNLIVNASDALGDRAGSITVTTGTRRFPRDFLDDCYLGQKLPEGRYAFLAVSDTGIGMDAETQERVFDPFFTTKKSGRGLGLATTVGIVRGHGGAIHVDSEPGKGTTFRVLFPPVDPSDTLQTQSPTASARGTILLADDEEIVRTVVSEILKGAGFEVLMAEDGQHAIDLFREHRARIDGVLLDVTMPRMGGLEALHAIRALEPQAVVLLASGFVEPSSLQEVDADQIAGFLEKPFTSSHLIATIEEALRRRGG